MRRKGGENKVGRKWGSRTGSYGLGRYLDHGNSESDLKT